MRWTSLIYSLVAITLQSLIEIPKVLPLLSLLDNQTCARPPACHRLRLQHHQNPGARLHTHQPTFSLVAITTFMSRYRCYHLPLFWLPCISHSGGLAVEAVSFYHSSFSFCFSVSIGLSLSPSLFRSTYLDPGLSTSILSTSFARLDSLWPVHITTASLWPLLSWIFQILLGPISDPNSVISAVYGSGVDLGNL